MFLSPLSVCVCVASSYICFFCKTGNLVVTGSFSSLLLHLGLGGTYLLYALMNGAAVAYVAGLVVETKRRCVCVYVWVVYMSAGVGVGVGVRVETVVVA